MLRGHSALHGACDFEINVADRTMTVAKQRDGASGEVFGFELEGVEIGRDEDGNPVTSCVAVTADVTQRHAQGPKLTAADRVALTTIQNLVAQHGEPLPQGTGFPTSRRHVGVSATAVSAALRGSVFADRTAEAAQKASERVRTKLQSLGLIGVNGGFVWIPKTLDQPTGTDMSATCPTVSAGESRPRQPTTPTHPLGMSVSVGASDTQAPSHGASLRVKTLEEGSVPSVRAAASVTAHPTPDRRH